MRVAQALRRAGRTDFIMVAGRWKQVALHEELRRGEESIDLPLQARQWVVMSALAVGLPASVIAGRVGVLRLKQARARGMSRARAVNGRVTCFCHVL